VLNSHAIYGIISALHHIPLHINGAWLLLVPVKTEVDLQPLKTNYVVIQLAVSRPRRVSVSSGHRLIWWGRMQCRFAMNPMLHRTILRKSITFAYVHLRGNKSKFGLEASAIKLIKP